MEKIENKIIAKYILIGIATWLTINSFSIIVKLIATFLLLMMQLKISIIFLASEILIILSVFLTARIAVRYIVNYSANLNSLLLKFSVIYIITEILKFASYGTMPILFQLSEVKSFHYFKELNENSYYKLIQFTLAYLKIIIFGLTVFFYQNKTNKTKLTPD